ncbi:transposase [Bradyrhizobium yuanmingense]|uniref:transposase n=1 Tax=Bradyrhizobium yuanmingense TaxID=108015 RepID=UPI003514589F
MPRKLRLQHLVFRDEAAARNALESLRWPEGPRCLHCSSSEVVKMGGKKRSHRDGLLRCKKCRRQFTVTVGTIFHRSKVPLTKWMQIIHLEDTPNEADTSWRMAQATGLTFKTVERMRARMYAAVGSYRGPNTVFGDKLRGYVRQQRPTSYQRPPKIPQPIPDMNVEAVMRGYRRWYAWRAKNPLGKRLEASGVLASMDNARNDLKRTERLLIQLLSIPPVPMAKRRRKSKKLSLPHLGWLKV